MELKSYEKCSFRFCGSELVQLEVKAFHSGSPGGNPGDRTCHYPVTESASLLWGSIGFHPGLRGNA